MPLVTDPRMIGSTSFTAEVVKSLLETPAGDFKGFQTVMEALQVRSWLYDETVGTGLSHLEVKHLLGPTQWRARDRVRVSCIIPYGSSASHHSPPPATWLVSAQLMPHLIVCKGPHGHRMVRFHTSMYFLPTLT